MTSLAEQYMELLLLGDGPDFERCNRRHLGRHDFPIAASFRASGRITMRCQIKLDETAT